MIDRLSKQTKTNIGFPKWGGFEQLHQLLKYRELLRNLVAKEFKLKYRGSALGFLWSLMNPLLMIIVYSIAFRFILRIPLEDFTLFLVIGLLHWNFFASTTIAATDAIIGNSNLINKIYFPRQVLPLSVVVFQLITFGLTMIVFIFAYLPLGGEFWIGQLIYPFIVLLQVVFVLGISLAISALNVFYRDLKHLIDVLLLMLFWLTPIIYNFTMIPDWARNWFRLNPMVAFAIPYQDLFYLREWPSLVNWAMMFFWAISAIVIGYYLFGRVKNRFPEAL